MSGSGGHLMLSQTQPTLYMSLSTLKEFANVVSGRWRAEDFWVPLFPLDTILSRYHLSRVTVSGLSVRLAEPHDPMAILLDGATNHGVTE